MKLFTFTLFVMFFGLGFHAKSQLAKGDKLLGGTAGINLNHGTSESSFSQKAQNDNFYMNLSPKLGWAIAANKISPHILLEASSGGLYANFQTISGDSKSYYFSAGANFPANFIFGVQFLLNSKMK